jgi:beta-lactamase superfamily II metal-dependent hydrolase
MSPGGQLYLRAREAKIVKIRQRIKMIAFVGAAHVFMLVGCGVDNTESETDNLPANLLTCEYPSNLEITTINIGQGDATIVATPTKLMLLDAGESYWNSTTDAQTIDGVIMAKYGCRKLDYVVISHFHNDHIGYAGYGGLYYLANDLEYTIGETILRDYINNVGTTSATYNSWVAYLDTTDGQTKLNPQTALIGNELDLGNGVIAKVTSVDTRTASCPDGWGSKADLSCGGEYVWPSEVLGDHRGASPEPDENGYSVSVVVSLGDFDMYFGGDLTGVNVGSSEHDVESYLAADIAEVDILKVNHHGSDHSTNPTFVSLTQPQAAIITVGNANTYGHARQSVVDTILGVVGGVPTRDTWLYMTERGDDGIGGCLADGTSSDEAAGNLYGQATIVSDTDDDYCTIEGGDVDIVVSVDGSSFTIEGIAYTSATGTTLTCDNDGLCEAGEDCVNCPNDCSQGAGAECGNGVCETGNGEDCLSCPGDCRGKQGGKPSKQYCCGDGDGIGPIGCDDSRCTEGFACISTPAVASCCGDATCNGLEDSCECAIDCGAPATSETDCDDGIDDNCNSLIDCDDPDCELDEACAAPSACNDDGVCDSGEDCLTCPNDCDGITTGKPSSRHCCGDGYVQSPEGDGSICDGNY